MQARYGAMWTNSTVHMCCEKLDDLDKLEGWYACTLSFWQPKCMPFTSPAFMIFTVEHCQVWGVKHIERGNSSSVQCLSILFGLSSSKIDVSLILPQHFSAVCVHEKHWNVTVINGPCLIFFLQFTYRYSVILNFDPTLHLSPNWFPKWPPWVSTFLGDNNTCTGKNV